MNAQQYHYYKNHNNRTAPFAPRELTTSASLSEHDCENCKYIINIMDEVGHCVKKYQSKLIGFTRICADFERK